MNEPSKLFRVLVLGGALIGASCTNDEATKTDASAPSDDAAAVRDDAAVRDEGVAVADADGSDAAEPTVDGASTDLCFCDSAGECCESDPSGASTPRPGIECCWGTSC